MSNQTRMLLAFFAVAGSLAGCLFVMGNSSIDAANANYLDLEMPGLTRWVAGIAPWALIVPVIMGGLSIVFRSSKTATACVCGFGFFFAIAWALLSIYASKIFYYHLIGGSAG